MAKKKESIYKTWDEVNFAMKELGELNVQKQKLEGEQTVKINEVKSYIQEKAGDIVTKIKNIEKEIERFAEQNKDEFIATRNKKLTFGTISYRLTKRVVCKSVTSAIKALKSLNMDFFIRTKEELNKEDIMNCCDKATLQALTRASVSVVSEDKIRIEPDYVKLMADTVNE